MLGTSAPSVSARGPGTSDDPFLNTTTPVLIGRHGPNRGAIIGGIIGGVAVISILVAALFFYLRRRSLVSSPVFDGDIVSDPHQDQLLRTTLSQETVSSCFSEMPTSLSRPYVHIFILSSSSA